ncbi:hypothetical protein IPZ68_08340 [Streptomyces arenae]|nr:hypothetical protein [Streptomyces arenae]
MAEHTEHTAHVTHPEPTAHTTRTSLFPPAERDKLALRLQNAVNAFVDGPRGAVEDADRVLEETITGLSQTLTERRRTLRTSWQHAPAGESTGTTDSADTEQLRLALRDYRETAESLLRL